MFDLLRQRWYWALGSVALVVVIIAGIALSGGGGEAEFSALADIERGPDITIVIPAGEPIVIGVSTALTGPVGARGAEYRDAVIVSVERWKEANGPQIGGHDIQVVAEDDGCTEAEQTGVAARRLLQRPGLVGVLGPQCSSGVAAVASLYRDAGIVAISGSATTTSLTADQPEDGFFFRTAYRNDLQGTLIGSSAGFFGQGRAVIVDNSEIYGQDLARNAVQEMREAGVSVSRVSVEQGAVDFSDAAARIMEADPAFVGFAGFNPEAVLLYRQLRDAGYEGVFFAGDGAASQVNFVDPVGEAAEGVLFAGCRFPLPEDFHLRLSEVMGIEPSATFAAHYADAATVLLNAVKEVAREQEDGSLVVNAEELRDAVRASSLDGLTGAMAFDSNGDRVPEPGQELADIQAAVESFNADVFVRLGLVACQVQDGRLANVFGPGAQDIRLQ